MDGIEVKRMYDADTRRKMAKSGEALPDGSFPISDEADLKNAIAAFGRAKDPEAAKAHILKRATDLDLEEMIPTSWGQKGADAMDDEDIPEDEVVMDDEEMDDEEAMEGKAVVRVNADGEATKCAKGLAGGACGFTPGDKVCGKCGAMAVQTKSDLEDDIQIKRLDVEDPDERAILRRLHLEDMGTKSADIDDGAYSCMMEQAVLPAGTAPCADCTGGCIGTKGLPDLAEIEAVAGTLFGKVVDSGYSDTADRFLVAVQRKDGLFEAHFDGHGSFQALIRLPEDWIADEPIITANEAVDNALAQVEGKALSIDGAVLEGSEVYSVEIEGVDGKSYDVFVDPVSGDVLAYDAYELSADEVEGGAVEAKSLDEAEFTAALMEFQLLEAEQDITPSE